MNEKILLELKVMNMLLYQINRSYRSKSLDDYYSQAQKEIYENED